MPPSYNAVKRSCNAFLLNINSVSSGEVKVEIFLSDIVKMLQQSYILALGRPASTVFFLCLTSTQCAL